jgi:hypothetical protein
MQQALLQIMQNQPCALELLWPPFLGAQAALFQVYALACDEKAFSPYSLNR